MQILAPTPRSFFCISSSPTHLLALALLLPLSAASQQLDNPNTTRKILKKIHQRVTPWSDQELFQLHALWTSDDDRSVKLQDSVHGKK